MTSENARFVKKEGTEDVWRCYSCKTVFKKKSTLRGTRDFCTVCNKLNNLYPYGTNTAQKSLC